MIGFLKSGIGGLPPVRLDAERVYLRPPRARDWKKWAALREKSQDFLTPWEPSWPIDALSRGAFVRRARRQHSEWRRDEGYSFLVFRSDDHALLGGIGLSNLRRGVAQIASVGYWIGKPYANQGFMTDSVLAIIEFGFFQLGLHRIEAACLPTNVASRRLLEKVGFQPEGHARAYLRIDGVWQDHLLFALLREDVEHRP